MTKSTVDASQGDSKRKPKRPLSAYNVFFREEILRIIRSRLGHIPSSGSDVKEKEKTTKRGRPRGRNYRKRNPHRVIGFGNLGRQIVLNWKTVHPDVLLHCKSIAEADNARYKTQKDQYIDEHNQKPLVVNTSDDACDVFYDDEPREALYDQKTTNFQFVSKSFNQLSLPLLGRQIMLNWKTVHPDVLLHCKIIAEADNTRYKTQMNQYIDEHNQKPVVVNTSDDACDVFYDDEPQEALYDQKTTNFQLVSKSFNQLSLPLERELKTENFDTNEEKTKNAFDPPRKKVLRFREKERIIYASTFNQLSLPLVRELNNEKFDRNEEKIKFEFDPPHKKVLQLLENEKTIFASIYL
eukprot:CAMPEP_0194347152 /NCGR_PEP_ID=MMETSP0171-20130528/105831_1 /TAXON_ID=218684 /ORGANISM="Corethron pennatum, Strain L29A3" /LENGTH=352 /DNA_ID=CAMNT_0039114373 /DNA_START=599 /DNA_END=1657 /DNA_ORIENTATION=-